uniref:Uncharacterized protein n=1 Tax=Lygus hesperus TaxID=30085 RepID=A0A146LAG2_LYGHE
MHSVALLCLLVAVGLVDDAAGKYFDNNNWPSQYGGQMQAQAQAQAQGQLVGCPPCPVPNAGPVLPPMGLPPPPPPQQYRPRMPRMNQMQAQYQQQYQNQYRKTLNQEIKAQQQAQMQAQIQAQMGNQGGYYPN